MLHIHVPEPNYLDFFGSPKAAEQIGMIKTMLAGARVLLAAEPNGALVRTSSPFVDGQRVTLLDIDLDTVLADETLLPRIQAVAATPAEAKAVLLARQGAEDQPRSRDHDRVHASEIISTSIAGGSPAVIVRRATLGFRSNRRGPAAPGLSATPARRRARSTALCVWPKITTSPR